MTIRHEDYRRLARRERRNRPLAALRMYQYARATAPDAERERRCNLMQAAIMPTRHPADIWKGYRVLAAQPREAETP